MAKLKSLLDIAEKTQNSSAKARILEEADLLAVRLAAILTIRPSRRDWIEIVLGGSLWLGWAVAYQIINWRPQSPWLLNLVFGVTYVVAFMGAMIVQARAQTLQFNRRIYVRLEAPSNPPLLSIPSVRDYLLRTTITPDLVIRVARDQKRESGNHILTSEDVSRAIAILEGRTYKHAPRSR